MRRHTFHSQPFPPTVAPEARRLHGFTLVELLVVIAILAILLAMLSPLFRHAMELARIATCASNQKQLVAATVSYSRENNGALMPWNDSTDEVDSVSTNIIHHFYYIYYENYTEHGNRFKNLGFLFGEGEISTYGEMPNPKNYLGDHHVLFCPSQEHYQHQPEMFEPWPAVDRQEDKLRRPRIRSAFYYNPDTVPETRRQTYAQRRYRKLHELNGECILLMDMLFWEDMFAHTEPFGFNVVYGDMAARFVRPEREALLADMNTDAFGFTSMNWTLFGASLEEYFID